MTQPLTVSDLARYLEDKHGVEMTPHHLSQLFYRRVLPDVGPIVAGARLIPVESLPTIESALRKRGFLVEHAELPTA